MRHGLAQELPLTADFLEQLAGSFGVERECALALLGDLLLSYEPARRYEIQTLAPLGISETVLP